jgi:hypothetical protein
MLCMMFQTNYAKHRISMMYEDYKRDPDAFDYGNYVVMPKGDDDDEEEGSANEGDDDDDSQDRSMRSPKPAAKKPAAPASETPKSNAAPKSSTFGKVYVLPETSPAHTRTYEATHPPKTAVDPAATAASAAALSDAKAAAAAKQTTAAKAKAAAAAIKAKAAKAKNVADAKASKAAADAVATAAAAATAAATVSANAGTGTTAAAILQPPSPAVSAAAATAANAAAIQQPGLQHFSIPVAGAASAKVKHFICEHSFSCLSLPVMYSLLGQYIWIEAKEFWIAAEHFQHIHQGRSVSGKHIGSENTFAFFSSPIY